MLQRVLDAREKRAQQRQNWADRKRLSLSLSFNIPGYPKSDNTITSAFSEVRKDLIRYITSCRLSFNLKESETTSDYAGDFFILPLSVNTDNPKEIKALFEDFEGNHPLSRLIDVDIFSAEGLPVSSNKAKKCLICSKPAIVCMREQNHSFEELRDKINNRMVSFLQERRKEQIRHKFTLYATKALMYEVSVTPKPGLVDRFSQGSHTDMDFFTFISSSSALSYYWREIVDLAATWDGKEKETILKGLRTTGIKMEEAMLSATEGANTQKGAIFLMGFTAFASAYYIINNQEPSDDNISSVISYLNTNMVEKELASNISGSSHGEKVFKKYGKELAGGIRLEVEEGLPTVFKTALPVLKKLSKTEENTEIWWNTALKEVLLHLMAKNNDTNILFRSNADILAETKQLAHICVEKESLERVKQFEILKDFCEQHNISPGGSADLLAVTCFIYWVQKEFKE